MTRNSPPRRILRAASASPKYAGKSKHSRAIMHRADRRKVHADLRREVTA